VVPCFLIGHVAGKMSGPEMFVFSVSVFSISFTCQIPPLVAKVRSTRCRRWIKEVESGTRCMMQQ
jgi:hypothetical protein